DAMTYASPGFHVVRTGESGTQWPFTWTRCVFAGAKSRIAPSWSSIRYACHDARGEPSGCSLSTRISGYIRLYFAHKGREREQYADPLSERAGGWREPDSGNAELAREPRG